MAQRAGSSAKLAPTSPDVAQDERIHPAVAPGFLFGACRVGRVALNGLEAGPRCRQDAFPSAAQAPVLLPNSGGHSFYAFSIEESDSPVGAPRRRLFRLHKAQG